jgi:predicted esterase
VAQRELDIPARSKSDMLKQTPVILGNVVEDNRVDIWLGSKAASCLKNIEVDVCWKKYEGLAHW